MYAIKDCQKWNHEFAASAVKIIQVQPALHIPETSAPTDTLPSAENEALQLQSEADNATKAEGVKTDSNKRPEQLNTADWTGISFAVEKNNSRSKRFLKNLKKLLCCSIDGDGS